MLSKIARFIISSGHPIGEYIKTGNAAAMDLFFRAAFLEGYLDLREGSVSRSPKRAFDQAARALESGESNPYVDSLRAKSVDEPTIKWLLSPSQTKLYTSVIHHLNTFLGQKGYKRTSPEDVLNAIVSGFNPFVFEDSGSSYTSRENPDAGLPKKIPRFNNHGGLYYVGQVFADGGPWTPNGMQTYIQKMCDNLIKESWAKKTNQELLVDEKTEYDADGNLKDGFFAEQPYQPDDIDFSDILNQPRLKAVLNDEVKEELRTPIQKGIWNLILEDSNLLRFKKEQGGRPSVNNVEVKALLDQMGLPTSEMNISKEFKNVVLPAMLEATSSSRFMRAYQDMFDLASTYRKEISRRAKKLARRYAALKRVI